MNPVISLLDDPLPLLVGSINPHSLSMGTLKREINLRQQPPWILRKLMSALESQRIARKLGWSRPWNKAGLTIFHALKLLRPADEPVYDTAFSTCLSFVRGLEPKHTGFLHELKEDPGLMAFVFYHNRSEIGNFTHEGLTLSLGRLAVDDPGKRDRLDIVFEDVRKDGGVDGRIDRVRIFVNPWSEYREGRHLTWENNFQKSHGREQWQALYEACIRLYEYQKDNPDRVFEHWSIRYIEYFGSRVFIPPGSRFT